jgi:type I restriction enzyme, S subunit
MSALPKAWVQVPLGKFAAKTKNVDPSKSTAEVFELYSVPSFSTDSPELIPCSEIKSSKQAVQPDDVLLCKIVPHINRVWTVKTKGQHRQIASGEWIVYRNHGCEPNYLRYCLSEESFREQFLSTVAGVGGSLMRARPSEVAKIEVPIPPLLEQRKIVAKLDSLTGRTARAQEQLGRIPKLIQKYREAILAAAFSGELTRGWRIARALPDARPVNLGSVASEFSYGSATKSSPTGEVPVLRMGNIQDGSLNWGDLVFTSNKNEIAKYELRAGDVLFNRTNSPTLVGKTALYRGECPAIYAGYLIRIRCSPALMPEFLTYCLNSPAGRDYCWRVKTDGVSQSNINAK